MTTLNKDLFLMGTIHGAFGKCDNKLPGIYVDDFSILQFLYKEAFGSGKNDSCISTSLCSLLI